MQTVGRRTPLGRQKACARALTFVCGQSPEDAEEWYEVDVAVRTGPSAHADWHSNEPVNFTC